MAVDRQLHVANGCGQTITCHKWLKSDHYILQINVDRQLHVADGFRQTIHFAHFLQLAVGRQLHIANGDGQILAWCKWL